jgi:GNAT superfamily N-acetyltransferase
MPEARTARADDISSLLVLFGASDVSAAAGSAERVEQIWSEILARDGVAVFVCDADAKIVSTCMLITVPNVLRSGRQHAFLENVVTHPEYRGRGFGRAVIHAALCTAWAWDCHHVLLQSGRADPRVHRFYEGCGFEPGLRVAYVAKRPLGSS